jgi:hypothetical protein
VGLLQPMIGREPRRAGADRGTVDGHGVGITCSNIDGALRTCHSRVQHCIAREARRAGVHVMAEVFGASLPDLDLVLPPPPGFCTGGLGSQNFPSGVPKTGATCGAHVAREALDLLLMNQGAQGCYSRPRRVR